MKILGRTFMLFSVVLLQFQLSFAHCDTEDGPVVAAAIKAIEQNNINYALIWIQPSYENELKNVFELTMKVRVLSPEARMLADKYFFETLVRLHRTGEGVPYTGIKPSGSPINENILAADKSIAIGNLSPLAGLVPTDKFAALEIRFAELMSLKNYDVNDIQAGRRYIEAYVQFFHLAEAEEENHETHFPILKNNHEKH